MLIWRPLVAAALVMALAACDDSTDSGEQSTTAAPSMPTGQLGTAVVPTAYDLDLIIVPDRESFSGRVEIDVEINEPSATIWLHGMDIEVAEVWLETKDRRIDAAYEQADATGIARLDLASVPPTGPARLNFVYSAPFNGSLEGLYKVEEGGEAYAFTQFEATSARLAFPSFDEPAFKVPFDIKVTAPEGEAVITATPEVASEPAGEGLVRHVYERTPPLPTYLIAFAVGPLDVVEWDPLPPTEIRDWPLPLRGVAAKGKGAQLTYALENTQGILEALEAYFAVPFPYPKLDIIAVPDFAAGAMENVGAITYREQLLLLDGQASLRQRRAYASVHAHELAHQWFGNLVTPKWWDDIWLNESFATWMGNKAVDAWRPDMGFANNTFRGALGVMSADALASARQIREPIRSNHDIATAFDGITYRKGGAVLAMFEAWLGEEAFRDGVRLHMARFAHDVADVDDFLQSLADGSGRPDVIPAFRSFLFQPGVPLVTATLDCDGATPAVDLTQRRYLPLGSTGERERTWQIPVCMAWPKEQGRARHCALLEKAEATVALPAAACPAWLMPNADGAGYYRFSLDADGWVAVFDTLAALTDREAQALLGSLSAAYRSDDASTETLADAFRILAVGENREVATAPIADLEFMHERLTANDAARSGIAAFIRDLYGPRLEALGLEPRADDDTDAQLLRTTLIEALATIGDDSNLRAELARRAEAYLAADPPDGAALPPGLVGIALAVAVEERDLEFARALLDRALASRDATFRQRAISALASAPQPEIGAMVRALIGDDRLRDNEAIMIAFNQVGAEAQRTAMWAWTKENLETLLARIPTWRKGAVVNMGAGFCSEERATEVETFFADTIEALEGGPRELAQTLERIRLCAALKAAKAGEVAAYFSP